MKIKGKGLTVSADGSMGCVYLKGRMAGRALENYSGATKTGYTRKYRCGICQLKDEKFKVEGSAAVLKALKKAKAQIDKGLIHRFIRIAGQTVQEALPECDAPEQKLAFAVADVKDGRAVVFTLGGCRVFLMREGALVQASQDHELTRLRQENPEMFDAQRTDEPAVSELGQLKAGDLLVMCSAELADCITDYEVSRICADVKEPQGQLAALAAHIIDRRGVREFSLVTAEVFK